MTFKRHNYLKILLYRFRLKIFASGVNMVKRSRGTLSGKSRFLRGRGKSKITVAKQVETFKIGEKVILSPMAEPKGMPHLRYAGRHGKVIEKRGKSYVIEIKDGDSIKKIIASSVHIKRA